jgi:beta-glucosidase/6-phospho-beta-glucosidase/beta-galactosidase
MSEKFFPEGFIWGISSNNYNEFFNFDFNKEIEMIEETKVQYYEFKISWKNLFLDKDIFNKKYLEKIIAFLKKLNKSGINPIITLINEKNIPEWFLKNGGFSNIENKKFILKYVFFVINETKDFVEFYNIMENSYILLNENYENSLKIFQNIIYTISDIKKIKSKNLKDKKIGLTFNFNEKYKKNGIFSFLKKDNNNLYFNFYKCFKQEKTIKPFLNSEKIEIDLDFFIINYHDESLNDSNILNGDSINTEKIKNIFNLIKGVKTPIIISSGGISDDQDKFRNKYIITILNQMHDFLNKSNIIGYIQNSLIDKHFENGNISFEGFFENKNDKIFKRNSLNIYSRIVEENEINERFLKFIM